MRRNVEKTINDYEEKFIQDNYSNTDKSVLFYPDEVRKIQELSPECFEAIYKAMEYGFMVGYNKAKVESLQEKIKKVG